MDVVSILVEKGRQLESTTNEGYPAISNGLSGLASTEAESAEVPTELLVVMEPAFKRSRIQESTPPSAVKSSGEAVLLEGPPAVVSSSSLSPTGVLGPDYGDIKERLVQLVKSVNSKSVSKTNCVHLAIWSLAAM